MPSSARRDLPRTQRLSLQRARAVTRREFLNIVRDPRSLILTLLYPISMLIMFGYGIRYDVDNVPLTILDRDETPESRALASAMIHSGYFSLVRWAGDEHEIDRDLTTDRSRAAVIIPLHFGDAVQRRMPAVVQAIIDGSDSNSATIARAYILAMVARFSATALPSRASALIEVRSRFWYNPELTSVNFIVPGVIAVIMMIVGASLTSLSVVKEKEYGTIEQILASPIRPLELVLGKIVPYAAIAVLDLIVVVAAAKLMFHVPMRGSLLELCIFSLLYLIGALGVGVLISTVTTTMENALNVAIFVSILPSILLSGFVFPIENMPPAIQVITYLFPGRYFVAAIRGIFLKGVGLSVLWPEAVCLALFCVTVIAVSAARFQDKVA